MKHFALFLLPFLYLFTGCATMYIPSPSNTPLFEEKGEGLLEAGISTNSIFATSSYAFSGKYALIANGALSYRNFSDKYDLFTHKDDSPPGSGGFLGPPPDRRGKFEHRYWEASMGKMNMLPRYQYCLFGQEKVI